MKHTKMFFTCGFVCMALFLFAAPAFAQEVTSPTESAVSQTVESAAPQESAPAPTTSAEAPSSAPADSSKPADSVTPPDPTPPAAASQSASKAPATEINPSSAAPQSLGEASSTEASSEDSSEVSSEDVSSEASSGMVVESGEISTDPLQGGTLSDGGGASRLYGLIAWIAVGIVAVALLIVLLFSKRTRGNKMSSGRAYARKRSVGYKRKRLLDDKYYQNLKRRR